MATRKKDRAAGYASIAETADTLHQLAAHLLRQAARGERRLVKLVVQYHYGDEEELPEGALEPEPPVPEESRHERTERLADDLEERYDHPRRW